MNLVTWMPTRELRVIQTYLNHVFGDTPFRRIDDDEFSLLDWAPLVDVQEADREYLIGAEFPAIKTEDVKVEMLNRVLTIEGERKQENGGRACAVSVPK